MVAGAIQYRTLRCSPSGTVALHLVRIDPRRAHIDAVVRPEGAAGAVARSGQWAVALNANFFDEQLRPLGLVMSGGHLLSRVHPVSWQSIFAIDHRGSAAIVLPGSWKSIQKDAVTAVQAGPRLVAGGIRIVVSPASAEPRSGVCIDTAGRVILFATGEEAFFDVREMGAIAADELSCRDAMLFDGGPSVQLFVRGRVDLPGDPRVTAFLVAR